MGCLVPFGKNGCVGCIGCLLPLFLITLCIAIPLDIAWLRHHGNISPLRQEVLITSAK